METLSIPIQLPDFGKLPSVDFPFIAGTIPNSHIISVPSVLELQSFLIKHAYDSPPLGIGAAVYLNNSSKSSVYALFNGIAFHTSPLSLLFVSNSLFKNKPGKVLFYL